MKSDILVRKILPVLVVACILALSVLAAVPIPTGATEGDPEVIPPTPMLYINAEPISPDEYGNYVIESNGVNNIRAEEGLEGSITLIGNGSWNLVWDAYLSGQLTVLGGTFTTNNFPLNCGSFYIGYYQDVTPIAVNLGSSKINCFAFAVRGSGVSLDPGTSHITTTLLFDDAAKTGRIYHDVTIKSDDKIYGFVEGNSKFNTLKMENDVSMYLTSNIEAVKQESAKGTITSAKTIKIIDASALESAKKDIIKAR